MSRLLLLTAAVLLASCQVAAAQEPQTGSATPSELERLKAETELLNAQTNKLKAETESENARKQAEINRLTAEKSLLEAQTAIEKAKRQEEIDKLKARKDLIEAATANIAGRLEGAVTFDDKGATSIENTVRAYEALQTLAPAIAAEIVKERNEGVFVILGATDRTALTALSVFEAQAILTRTRLDELQRLKTHDALAVPTATSEPQSPMEALALAAPVINLATGLIGLFRVDDKYVVKDETPDLRAVYGSVAKAMQAEKREIYFPEAMAPGLFATSSKAQDTLNGIGKSLQDLWLTYFDRVAKGAAQTKVAEDLATEIKDAETAAMLKNEIKQHQEDLKNPATTPARAKELAALIAQKEKAIPAGAITDPSLLSAKRKHLAAAKAFLESNATYVALLDKVLKAGDEYIAAMTKSDATSTAPLAALIAAERLRDVYTKSLKTTYAVELGVHRLSGTRKEHRNFFRTSLSFSGGVVVSYRVFQAETGRLLASDTLSRVMPFAKAKEQ
jgi:hypothetical protein